jgi:hypothetical protein
MLFMGRSPGRLLMELDYRRPRAMPQAFGSSGAHMGVGRALVRATVTLAAGAAETWVVATAAVRAKAAAMAMRVMLFMVFSPDQ